MTSISIKSYHALAVSERHSKSFVVNSLVGLSQKTQPTPVSTGQVVMEELSVSRILLVVGE